MVTKEPKVEIDTRPPYKNEAKKLLVLLLTSCNP